MNAESGADAGAALHGTDSDLRTSLQGETGALNDETTGSELPPAASGADAEQPAQLQASWYYWIFAASGFAGLIYESIWARYLKLLLGSAAYAQALVLAIFLLGLAVGAALCARWSQQVKRPLLWYAGIEVLVALLAVYFHELYVVVQDWTINFMLPQIASDQTAEVVKWGIAALLILPQSILLGATFPLMSAGVVRLWPQRRGELVAMLYFSNSLGAVFGVLASGFIFVSLLGLPGTVALAGFINVGAAFAVWLLSHQFDDRGEPLAADKARAATFGRSPLGADVRLTALITLVAFGTGLASFIYEIIWVRMLSLLLGTATHTFETMLAAFILGLALGSAAVHRLIDRGSGDLLSLLGKIQIAMGVFALWSLFSFPIIYDILIEALKAYERNDTGYIQYMVTGLGLSLLMLLPATFCAGMTLPLLTRRLLDSGGESAIGRVYAANTLGAIVGVFIAVHLLLPLTGLKYALLIGAAIDMLLGVILISWVQRAQMVAAFSFSVLALVLTALVGMVNPKIVASGIYRHRFDLPSNVIFYREGKTASVTVVAGYEDIEEGYESRSIQTNGKSDSNVVAIGDAADYGYTGDEATTTMLALMSHLYKPEAKRILNIGFGTGMTSRALLLSDHLQQLDNVEIEPMMIEGAKYLGERPAPVFSDPRSHFIINDAKSVMARTPTAYDTIISEPSNPWVSGIANLYTKEFYQRVHRALADDGLFVQWIHLYEFNPQLMASIAQALGEVFGDYDMYLSSGSDLIFVASAGDSLPPKLNAIFASDEARAYLAGYDFHSAEDINASWIGDKELLVPYFESFGIPANSDYYPYLETHAHKAFYLGYLYGLGEILLLPVPIYDFLGSPKSVGDILPGQYSPVRQRIAGTRQLYQSRLEANGWFQTMVRRLQARSCPLPIAIGEQQDAAVATDEEAGAYMVDVSSIVTHLMPYGSKAQMTEIWRLLEQDACVRALLEDQEHSASLYTQFWKALSLRQGDKLVELTPALLQLADLNTMSGQTLYIASMAANYQVGNYRQVVLQMFDLPNYSPSNIRHAAQLIAASAAQRI